MAAGRTLYEKIWDAHVVHEEPGKPSLIYIDRHLIHEGTSPQAFAGLKAAGRKVRRPELTFAAMDHSVSTKDRLLPVVDEDARNQFEALAKNCEEAGVHLFDMHSKNQGIVHVIGPELGITQPGQTIVCGDSHTSTHGAFGALAFGIGTSEIEHVLATQCLSQFKSKTMKVAIEGPRPHGVTAKDMILAVIGKIGIAGGTGYVFEYNGRSSSRPLDGRPHDHVQHVDRRRRARRNGSARRHDVCLHGRAARSCRRARNSKKPSRIGEPSPRTKTRSTTKRLR